MASLIDRFSRDEEAAVLPETEQQPRSFVDRFQRGSRVTRGTPTFGDEFERGLAQGTDSLQMSLYGATSMLGRELGISSLEEAGNRGVERNRTEIQQADAPTIGSVSEIEDAGDFFRWAAGGLGQAVPSLASTIAGGGIGGIATKKAVELGLKRAAGRRIARDLTKKGIPADQARAAGIRAMNGDVGKKVLREAIATPGRTGGQIMAQALGRGRISGAVAAGALPIAGQTDIELQEAGVGGTRSALTALTTGAVGGGLEALPALRLLDKMFPGVDREVSKAFVKDLAAGVGSQAALEGSTEGAQEMIQIAALAFHDPTFDPFSDESRQRVVDAFAIGALVGGVTGGGADLVGQGTSAAQRFLARPKVPDIPEYDVGEQITDPDFEPADNTVFEEIQGRIRRTASDTLSPLVNSVRNQGKAAIDKVTESFGTAMNGELGVLTKALAQGHQDFVNDNRELLDRVTKFSNESARRIYEQAQLISDPVARQEFISTQTGRVKSEIDRVAKILRDRAKRQEQRTADTIDDIDLIDGAELAEANPTQFVFGKNKTGGRESSLDLFRPDEAEVQGFATRKAARNLLGSLRERFPSATDATFAINQQNDGTFVVELNDPANAELLMEDDRITRGLERARVSARRHRNNKRKVKLDSGSTIDFPSLVFAARDLTDVSTWNQGVAVAAGRLLERGLITSEGSQELINQFSSKNNPDLPDRPTEIDKDFNALPPRTKERINARVNEELNDERLTGEDRAEMRQQLLFEELTELNALTPAQRRDEGREEQGDEARFMEEGQGRGLESEDDQARASVSRRPFTNKRETKPRVNEFEKKQTNGSVYMPGASRDTAPAVQAVLDFVQKKLGLKTTIRVVNKQGAANMIARGHAHAHFAQRMEGAGVGRLVRGTVDGQDFAYVLLDSDIPAHVQATVLMHELGHQVYHENFSELSGDMKKKLRSAFVEDNKEATKSRVRGRDRFIADEAEFNEWMADQLVAWSNTRSEPVSVIHKFMAQVSGKLKALYDFLAKNPRFSGLDATYSDFIQGVSDRARGVDSDIFFKNEAQPEGFRLPELKVDDIRVTIPNTIPAETIDSVLARYESRFPVTVQRATLIRNWIVKAYSVVAAPSNSSMLDIGKRVPEARRLVNIFGRTEHGQAKEGSNYHQRINLMRGRFSKRYLDIVKNLSEAEKLGLVTKLREADGDTNFDVAKAPKKIRELRSLFDDLHNYLVDDAGLPLGKIDNYFPGVLSREKLVSGREEIITRLREKNKLSQGKAEAFYNSLISQEAEQAAALRELGEDTLASQAPGFRNMRSRTMEDPFFDKFREDNLDSVVANYINSAVKRGEFNRFLGMNSKTKKGWKPRGKYDAILKNAELQEATESDLKFMKKFVDANLGMLGRDFDRALPGARTVMASMMAYQNMRVLMFTVFASLPDLVGPAIRTGNMRQAFTSMMDNIKEATSSQSELNELARTYGIVSDQMIDHIFTEYVDNHYMPPQLRKWNDAFFKYTGLQSYTNFTRRMALAVGRDYIKNQARITRESPVEKDRFKATAALRELGLTPERVEAWVAEGEPTWDGAAANNFTNKAVAEALVQFVDESIMRPNASQRPLLASHPAAMLLFHLKGYMYALYEVAIRRMAHNYKIADTPAQAAAAIAPAILMMALTAVGLELRELVQYGLSDREPPSDRMDGWEYTWVLVERSGLLGPAQLGFDFGTADKFGMTGVAAVGGPTLGQFADVLSRPPSQNVPKAIPIIGQIPWARDGLREVTPL